VLGLLLMFLMLLIDVLGAGLLEVLGEMLSGAGSEIQRQHRRLLPALVVLTVGLGLGVGTALMLPTRLLHPGPFPGVSLIVIPPLLALWMHTLGLYLRIRGRTPSHVATWYGGAALGIGLTTGRLAILWLTGGK
jgi:hypothetical protein